MEILDGIFARRSIRKFTAQPVEQEKIEMLLKAAMAAPSAMNAKPWHFLVITEPDSLAALRSIMPFGKMIAPLAMIVCGEKMMIRNPLSNRFWVQDCSAATQNILLAAVALGLGSVWCGVTPIPHLVKPVKKLLQLPAQIDPLNVIYIGYPDEQKPARSQYDDTRVHWQHYGNHN